MFTHRLSSQQSPFLTIINSQMKGVRAIPCVIICQFLALTLFTWEQIEKVVKINLFKDFYSKSFSKQHVSFHNLTVRMLLCLNSKSASNAVLCNTSNYNSIQVYHSFDLTFVIRNSLCGPLFLSAIITLHSLTYPSVDIAMAGQQLLRIIIDNVCALNSGSTAK